MRYAHFNAMRAAILMPLMAVTLGVPFASAHAQMTVTDWNAKAAALDQRMTDLNARIQSLLAQCSGSVPIEQASAIQARCDAEGGRLKAEMNQLLQDRANLLAQRPG